MLRPASLRFRLSAWYTLVLLACLGLFGLGAWIAVRNSVTHGVDQSLVNRMDRLRQFLEYTAAAVPPQEVPEELKEFAMGVPEGNLLQVRDSNGEFLLTGAYPAGATGREITIRGARYRTLSQTLVVRGRRYDAIAAASLAEREYILRRFGVLLLVAVPFVLLVAGFGGFWMGRTLERLDNAVKRLTQFTADASHELRSPVAVIRTTAEIALRHNRSEQAYRDALQQIREESERTSQLIEDLLALARADAGAGALELAPIDLAELVEEVCRQERKRASGKSLTLDVRLSRDNVLVYGNEAAIRRLIRVLVDNAVKYTPAGGEIEVSVEDRKERVELCVKDNGIGITGAELPHVFDRFYRADKARSRDEGGCGLGLSIAQWIARCHGAEIQAESAAGQGSVFRIAFKAGCTTS